MKFDFDYQLVREKEEIYQTWRQETGGQPMKVLKQSFLPGTTKY